MITDPDYIEWLRGKYRTLDVLNLIQISGMGRGWYLLGDLSCRCGMQRPNLNTSVIRLRKAGLIRYEKHGNAGVFVWFIKDSFDARPNHKVFPRWRLVDHELDNHSLAQLVTVRLGEQDDFARKHHYNPKTVRNFLNGTGSKLLHERWSVHSTPYGQYKDPLQDHDLED